MEINIHRYRSLKVVEFLLCKVFWKKESRLLASSPLMCYFKGTLLFVTYTIIQGIISSEMLVRTGPLNGKCKKK